MQLHDSTGKQVSLNTYWLSARQDVLDWKRSTWFYTPTNEFSDLKALNALPRVAIKIAASTYATATEGLTRVIVENPSRSLAFFLRLKVVATSGDREEPGGEILPVLWEDNYFSLFPGEKREVVARYPKGAIAKNVPTVEVDGWNVPLQSVAAPSKP